MRNDIRGDGSYTHGPTEAGPDWQLAIVRESEVTRWEFP